MVLNVQKETKLKVLKPDLGLIILKVLLNSDSAHLAYSSSTM